MQNVWAILDSARSERAAFGNWRARILLATLFAMIPVVDHLIGYRSDFPMLVAISLALFTAALGAAWPVIVTAVVIGAIILFGFRDVRVPSIAELFSMVALSVAIVYGARLGERLAREISVKGWQISRREAYLERLVFELPTPIVICDGTGRVIHSNALADELFGYGHANLVNRTIERLLACETGDLVNALLWTPTDNEGTGPFAAQAVTRSGERREVTVSHSHFESGSGFLHLLTVVDETERLSSQRALAQVNADIQRLGRAVALGQFGAAFAHELNQPLAAAANYAGAAQAILEREQPRGPASDAIGEVLANMFRARAIVARIRAFVGTGAPRIEWEDTDGLVSEAIALAMPAITTSDAVLRQQMDAAAGEVLADRIGVQQVLMNLLVNAAEAVAGQSEKSVGISVEVIDHVQARFAVWDNGPGLSAKARERLFEPFSSTKANGVGVGLSISKSIIADMGGELRFGDRDGGGAEFSFVLPWREGEG